MIPTFLIDPNRLSREGLERLLSPTRFEVIDQASDIAGAIARWDSGRPVGMVIADINALSREARCDLEALRATACDSRIVVLGARIDPAIMATCFSAGVDGYLHQNVSSQALVASLDLILAGERVYPPELISQSLRRSATANEPPREKSCDPSELSPRECDILRLLTQGQPNKVIALELDVAEATVKAHLKSILRKIGVQNRTQAAIWALNNFGSGDRGTLRKAS